MNESIVISRTEGRYWILAGVLLLIAGGFVWLALASTQRSPGIAGWVFGGAFGLLGLNKVVLSPARDDFESHHRSLVRIGGGDFPAAGIGLYEREVPRVREALAKHVGVRAELVAPVLAPPPVTAAVPEWMPPPRASGSVVEIHLNGWDRATQWWLRFFVLAIELGLGAVIEFGPHNGFRTACKVVFTAVFVGMSWREIGWRQNQSRKVRIMLELSATGLRWVSYYRQIAVSWPEIAELRTPTRLLEFRPASDDFPLCRPELHELRQTDGWYRLPATLSATASKEFEARIREVLPGGIAWTG